MSRRQRQLGGRVCFARREHTSALSVTGSPSALARAPVTEDRRLPYVDLREDARRWRAYLSLGIFAVGVARVPPFYAMQSTLTAK